MTCRQTWPLQKGVGLRNVGKLETARECCEQRRKDNAMTDIPKWLATENAVETLFRLYGFEAESVSIDGRQIDIVATRRDAFGIDPARWSIKVTVQRVDADKGSKD